MSNFNSKPTKKVKGITVQYALTESYITTYSCPTCKTQYTGFIQENTTRFLCSCGQELYIKSRTYIGGN
jgi:hypothetical protein